MGVQVTIGNGKITTLIALLGPSQPPTVWLTYHVVVPTAAVEGTGAIADPTPPVDTVYQSRPVPVAVSAAAATFMQ